MADHDALFTELGQAKTYWTNLFELLIRGKYDTASPRVAIKDSVEILDQRLVVLFEIVEALRPESGNNAASALFSTRSNDIHNSISEISKNIQGILNVIKDHARDNIEIKDANGNLTLQFYEGPKQIASVDVAAHFQAINQQVNQGLLPIVSLLLPLCKPTSISDLHTRAQGLAAAIRDIDQIAKDVRATAAEISQKSANAADQVKKLQEVIVNAETIQTKLQATQQQIDKESASIVSLIEKIKATGTSADALDKQVRGYQATFEAFQKQLDDRNKTFVSFETNTKTAIDKNIEREKEIDRLILKADTMIRGSTTAGLSKSLEDAVSVYGIRHLRFCPGCYGSRS